MNKIVKSRTEILFDLDSSSCPNQNSERLKKLMSANSGNMNHLIFGMASEEEFVCGILMFDIENR